MEFKAAQKQIEQALYKLWEANTGKIILAVIAGRVVATDKDSCPDPNLIIGKITKKDLIKGMTELKWITLTNKARKLLTLEERNKL